MSKNKNSRRAWIPGLLLLTGMLMWFIAGGLWVVKGGHGINQWLFFAAIAAAVVSQFLGVLLVALLILGEDNEIGNVPTMIDRSSHSSAGREEEARYSAEHRELFGAIQDINRSLDKVVGQVRERLHGMAPVADDRNLAAHELGGTETPPPAGRDKHSLH